MKVVIAGDHHALELMQHVAGYLASNNVDFKSVGSKDLKDKKALQQLIPIAVETMRSEESTYGIFACGTGVGVEIAANRFKGVRASLCTNATTAKNARVYDDANVLCLSSWETKDAADILDAWFANSYDGSGERRAMFAAFDEWAGR